MTLNSKKIVNVVVTSDTDEGIETIWFQCQKVRDEVTLIENTYSPDLSSLDGKEVCLIVSSKKCFFTQSDAESIQNALDEILPGAVSDDYYAQKSHWDNAFEVYEFIHHDDLNQIFKILPKIKITNLILESAALAPSSLYVSKPFLGICYGVTDANALFINIEGKRDQF